jgi:hypothetical protein
MLKTVSSKNLWLVKVSHRSFVNLMILATTAESAARKAVSFSKRNDGIKKAVVTEVKFSGTIDEF